MVACVVKIVLGPDTQWEIERIADIFTSLLKDYKARGFRYASYLFEYDTGEYQGIAYWDAPRDYVESLIPEFIPLLREMTKHHCQWEPSVELYSVYEPRVVNVQR